MAAIIPFDAVIQRAQDYIARKPLIESSRRLDQADSPTLDRACNRRAMNKPDSTTPHYWLGVDTGGTFTDFVLFDG